MYLAGGSGQPPWRPPPAAKWPSSPGVATMDRSTCRSRKPGAGFRAIRGNPDSSIRTRDGRSDAPGRGRSRGSQDDRERKICWAVIVISGMVCLTPHCSVILCAIAGHRPAESTPVGRPCCVAQLPRSSDQDRDGRRCSRRWPRRTPSVLILFPVRANGRSFDQGRSRSPPDRRQFLRPAE